MRRAPLLLVFGFCALLCGCPGDTPTPPKSGDGSAAATPDKGGQDGKADTPADPAKGGDPLEGSIFSKDDLFAIYAAEAKGGDERTKVLTQHRLIDGQGQPIPARQAAFDRALQRYAEGDPEGWAAFLESNR